MLFEINGDLINSDIDIIVHQTNCFKTMGAGIAKQIKEKYPEVYIADVRYQTENGPMKIFGTINCIRLHDNRICINMYSQYRYGREKRYTDYEKFALCLARIASGLKKMPKKMKVGFPYGIGCGNAGGNWEIIKQMLNQFSEMIQQDVYIICR